MKGSLISLGMGLLCILAVLPSSAQKTKEFTTLDHEGCKVYFMPIWADPGIPGGFMPYSTKKMMKWYAKKGLNKYPQVCMSAAKATYLIMWTRQTRESLVSLPVFHQATTEISGDVQASGTTSWWSTELHQVQHAAARVFIFASENGKPMSEGGQLSKMPLFFSEREGRWRWSEPTKGVYDDALKFLTTVAVRDDK